MADTLGEILKKVRKIELITRGIVKAAVGGEYHSVFKGQGIDFDDFREYAPGDEVRSIDWNVTARMGFPYIKKFVEERELTVFLAVDVSASKNFGGRDQSKRELAAEMAALFAFSAIHNQDKVGLLLFSDDAELFLAPRKGSTHCLRIIREILYCQPKGRGTDVSMALDKLTSLLPRRSLVILISDFIAGDFSRALGVASVRHDVVAVQISDAAEDELPDAGWIRLIDPETDQMLDVNTGSARVRNEYQRLRSQWKDKLNQTFKNASVDKIDIHTGMNYQPALHAFFKRRAARS
ncbi:MAG TPA: DUF58 domain-containing protein [Verrucomicrobiales bacterium]|jgi:uncharacterized protein (DUF58 family)|nr:DUF58 domain-containing protein [Verrucomicrobiales bacterium]